MSIGEIAIKRALGNRHEPPPFSAKEAASLFAQAGYDIVPLMPAQVAAFEELPFLHKDPFDRLLVAQALHEPYTPLASDKKIAAYDRRILLV